MWGHTKLDVECSKFQDYDYVLLEKSRGMKVSDWATKNQCKRHATTWL